MERTPRAAARAVAQPAAQTGSSRIHLTHILRGGAIWNVFIATTVGHGAPAAVLLEFERTRGDDQPARYSTALAGRLRDALYGGGSVSRADLVHELELAIRTDAARLDEAAAAGSTE
ncbi:MAG TPA: hypothetical protein VMN60_13880 [Longimicrobiales bacterium]|nr:hypothetical protein [Longimicrobiales bacterium]